ncbi:MAG: hypothetical protein AB1589_42925 [Cyanobacteriota bacterium]
MRTQASRSHNSIKPSEHHGYNDYEIRIVDVQEELALGGRYVRTDFVYDEHPSIPHAISVM